MRKLLFSLAAAMLAALVMAAAVLAAGPAGRGPADGRGPAADRGTEMAAILGLTDAQIQQLRHDGRSLAQIAEQQQVDPQKLVDALMARWTERIEARVAVGALTPDEATALKAQLEVRARDMVYRTTLGGMQGAAVGAGPRGMGAGGAGGGAGMGPRGDAANPRGNGSCDGTGTGGGYRGGAGQRAGAGS